MAENRTVTIRRVIDGRALIYEVPARGLVTGREAAALLGVTLRWIYQLIKAGRLRAIRRRGRVLVSVRAVLAYAEAQRQPHRTGGEPHGQEDAAEA